MKEMFKKTICMMGLLLICSHAHSAGTETEATGTISVKDSSDSANNSNSAGQLASLLTGAKLFGESADHFSKCPLHGSQCALGALKALLGALSMMQGGAHGNTAMGANFSSGLTDGSMGSTPGYQNPYADKTAAAYQDAKNALAKLEKGVAGSKVDLKNGKITTADGKVYDINKSSAEGLASQGFSPGAISGAMEYGAKVSKEMMDKVDKMKLGAMTSAAGFDEGGGRGGRIGAGSTANADGSSSNGGVASPREPANMAGMQKNYNGEPIGVSADSIFLMMNRRYKLKESQDSFFTDAELALKK